MATYRLKYEFARLTQTDSVGFTDSFPGLTETGTTIDGAKWYEVTDYIEEPDKVTFSFGQSDTDNPMQLDSTGIDKGLSSKLTVFSEGYLYVRHWLIDHERASINSLQVRITDVSCGNKSMGIWEMKADNLKWCIDDECRLEVNLTEYTPKGNCLKNTLISDNHRNWFPDDGVPDGKLDPVAGTNNVGWIHPVFKYCDDIKPQFIQNFLFAIANGLKIAIMTAVGPIMAIAAAIDTIWNAVFGSGSSDLVGSMEEDLDDIYKDIFGELLGCERMHPAPFVRNYFINACSKCGVTFESNIFNDPSSPHGRYYNTCHLFAPVVRGYKDNEIWDDKKDWIAKNAPYDSLLAYAYSLKDIFNAKFKLENGVFSFHTKDKFPLTTVFDFTTEEHKKLLITPLCYAWNAQKKYQSTTFEFAQDVKDVAGDEALHRYNGTKDWTADLANKTDKAFYDGVKEIKSELYSATRFTTDGIDKKAGFKKLDETDFWPNGIMLMDKDVCQLGKLIIWDGVSEYKDARVIKIAAWPSYYIQWDDDWVKNNFDSSYFIYNYPMFFDWETNEGVVPIPLLQTHKNLYDLHKIDDPTQNNVQNKSWNTIMELCCETLNILIFDDSAGDGVMAHLDYLVQLNASEKGTISRIEIDYDKNEIRLSGEIKYTL